MDARYLHLSPGSELPKQSIERPYAGVVILDVAISREWRDKVSRWLVRSGCLYMMSWGVNCVEFHDSVDCANIEEFDKEEIPVDKFVLTTWHDDEPLEEVLWFAQHSAHHEAIKQKRILLLDVSQQPRENVIMQQLVSSFDLHLRESE